MAQGRNQPDIYANATDQRYRRATYFEARLQFITAHDRDVTDSEELIHWSARNMTHPIMPSAAAYAEADGELLDSPKVPELMRQILDEAGEDYTEEKLDGFVRWLTQGTTQ